MMLLVEEPWPNWVSYKLFSFLIYYTSSCCNIWWLVGTIWLLLLLPRHIVKHYFRATWSPPSLPPLMELLSLPSYRYGNIPPPYQIRVTILLPCQPWLCNSPSPTVTKDTTFTLASNGYCAGKFMRSEFSVLHQRPILYANTNIETLVYNTTKIAQ